MMKLKPTTAELTVSSRRGSIGPTAATNTTLALGHDAIIHGVLAVTVLALVAVLEIRIDH